MRVSTGKPRGRSPDRTKTDDSLRTERKNTDDALKDGQVSADREADDVLDHARGLADAVLSAARLEADQESRRPTPRAAAGAVVAQRTQADRTVRGARATADIVVREDREDRADALAALLVHERAVTDAYLVTERARSDEAVANRDDFLGMVAHDVRNLLNAVVLNLELLQPAGGGDPEPQVVAAVNRIRRNVARMNRLIGDLVDVTSINKGKLAVARVPGDLAALVAEAAETFQPAAVEKGVSLTVEVPAGPLPAEMDHGRMLQVFANLLSNAIKFTPRGGQIRASGEVSAGLFRFCIRDTGVGIPPAMLEAIFERFWQVGANDRRGQGLGLYISKSIVEAHGGRIWAESVVGEGSRIFLTLPVPGGPSRDRRRRR
jgi:signal transduction histidine kinase